MWQVTIQKYGTSALGLQCVLSLGSYQTAWTWLHKLRRVIGDVGVVQPHPIAKRRDFKETIEGGNAASQLFGGNLLQQIHFRVSREILLGIIRKMDGGKQPVVESSQEVEIRQFLPDKRVQGQQLCPPLRDPSL